MSLLKKLPSTLKEIRIHLCPKSPSSNGVRQFIEDHYIGLKSQNPGLPVLIRECRHIEPKIWFRFEYGKETSNNLANLNGNQIAGLLKDKLASHSH